MYQEVKANHGKGGGGERKRVQYPPLWHPKKPKKKKKGNPQPQGLGREQTAGKIENTSRK